MAITSDTTQLIYEPDWAGRAEQRLLVPWRKPRIRAFVRALAAGVQLHEDQVFDLIAGTDLDVATGHALDQWGELVGEQRLGLSDNEYRQFVKARMLVNRSASTTDELIEILEVAAAPMVGVFHEHTDPATIILTVVRNGFVTEPVRRRIARLMQDASPSGRRLVVIEALAGGFGFDGTDYGTTGFDRGGYARLILGDP